MFFGRGNKRNFAITVGTTPTLVAAPNSARLAILIVNNSGSTIYVGVGTDLTTSNGIPIAAGASYFDQDSVDSYYGVIASATGDLRVLEVSG